MQLTSPVLPSRRTKRARACACRSDLRASGIDPDRGGRRGLYALVRRHLDYFQLMLGYDASPAEIVALFERTRASLPQARRGHRPEAAADFKGEIAHVP